MLCIHLFLAVLGLRCCAGFSRVAVSKLLIVLTSIAEQGPEGMQT